MGNNQGTNQTLIKVIHNALAGLKRINKDNAMALVFISVMDEALMGLSFVTTEENEVKGKVE